MKAYGSNVVRDGKKSVKFACCDLRNGCCSHKRTLTNTNAWRAFKRRARAAGKAEAKAQVD